METTELSIDDLPSEVLERIIAHLNVEDRKLAALVSRRWSRFAFSRIALGDVRLDLNCAARTPRQYWQVLEPSTRNYRNVVLRFAADDGGDLLKILDKFQDSLERVTLEQDPDARLLRSEVTVDYLGQLLGLLGNVREFTVKTVLELEDEPAEGMQLPRLEKLERLCLYTHNLENDWIDWAYIAPNLRSLAVPLEDNRLGFPEFIKGFSAQLRNLAVDARFVERDQLGFCQESFPGLQSFRLLYPINNPVAANQVPGFIQNCNANLTEISLFSNCVDEHTLNTMTANCAQLRVVSIDANEVPVGLFGALSKLAHLKQLVLHKMKVEPAMITSSGGFPALDQLTCLSIRIDSPDAFFAQLQKKMPKLEVLELLDRFRFGINNFNGTGVIGAVCGNLRNLKRLALVDWAILDVGIFEKLDALPDLKELRLKCIGLNARKVLPVCNSVTKLVLDIDSMKASEVIPPVYQTPLSELISQGFPSLRTVELPKRLLDRTKASENEIAALQACLPAAAFYRKTRLKLADKDYAALM